MIRKSKQDDDDDDDNFFYNRGNITHIGDITSLDNEPQNIEYKSMNVIGFIRPKGGKNGEVRPERITESVGEEGS